MTPAEQLQVVQDAELRIELRSREACRLASRALKLAANGDYESTRMLLDAAKEMIKKCDADWRSWHQGVAEPRCLTLSFSVSIRSQDFVR